MKKTFFVLLLVLASIEPLAKPINRYQPSLAGQAVSVAS